ncbi:hypothetical protein BH23ACT10_BH23ACT10_19300 [soil metagenome]
MNLCATREREVSVVDVEVPLTITRLSRLLCGREAYRRTRYIVARRGAQVAVVEVDKRTDEPLFSEITDVRMLAGPDDCAVVTDPDVDVAVASQLAAAAATVDARCVVVEGRYAYIGFICDPAPLQVRIVDVVPPHPAKLVDQAQRVLAVADDLPPVALDADLLDLRSVPDTIDAAVTLFPCRASGLVANGATAYLDQRPERADWALVGCARSREIHRWFYGDEPPTVDTCPRRRTGQVEVPTLVRCCLRESGIEHDGTTVVVGWGASLAEVRQALTALVEQAEQP